MPIYAARWPDFTLSLVEARDERGLKTQLSELDGSGMDATGLVYKRLQKPLFLTLKVDYKEKKNKAFNLGELLHQSNKFCDITFSIHGKEIVSQSRVSITLCLLR